MGARRRNVSAVTTYRDVEVAGIDENTPPFLYVCAPSEAREVYRSSVENQFNGADFIFTASRLKERVLVACNPRLKRWIAWTIDDESEIDENFYWVCRGSEYWGRYRPTVKPTREELAKIRGAIYAKKQERKEYERELRLARRESVYYWEEPWEAYPTAWDYEPTTYSGEKIWVRPYTRKDGTPVKGHWRRKPSK